MRAIALVLLCLLLLSGCYTHIAWAKHYAIGYIVMPLPVEEWQKRVKKSKYPRYSIGAYLGKELGVHWITVRDDWCGLNRATGRYECNKSIVNHELKHARFPDWNHWMR